MMRKIAAVAIVAALVAVVNADAFVLHNSRAPLQPWELSKVQPKVNMQETVQMNIALKRKNTGLLEKILLEVSDPKSAKYGEHMSNDAMKKLISPGEDAVAKVLAWLARHGINDVEVATHADGMKFKATRAQVSSLLNVQWATYDNKETEKSMVRALGATSIPDHLASIVEMVQGHRGWPIPVAPKKAKKDKKKADFGTQITPSVIYQAYNQTGNIPTTPAGQTNLQSFAQFQGQYVLASDLTQFCNTYLPNNKGNCSIQKYIGGTDGSNPGTESSLDSEYIIATSMGADTWVYTYSGMDFCSDLLTWAQDVFSGDNGTHPYVISMSYGSQSLSKMGAYCEGSGASRLSVDTMKMGSMGISVLIASGDEGSGFFSRAGFNWGYLNPSFPAEMPYVTSVGSTTFENGNSGTQRAAGFSGGGFSWNWDAPTYQKDAIQAYFTSGVKLPNTTQLHYNATGRATPDVSFLGEDFTVISGGFTEGVAGTSCSTPSMAGMVTLLNNIRLKNGKTLGFLNPLLYQNPSGFTDVTIGSNGGLFSDGWNCATGWDPVTGLGTPNFGMLADIVEGLNTQERARKHM